MTVNREDPFAGVWKLNPQKSHFDPSHCASGGTMYWEPTSEGYRMRAEGTKSDGQVVEEKPQAFILDGKDHPLADMPGVTAIASRTSPNTIHVQAQKAGRVVGKASYVVSEDGTTLTANVSGMDAQQRPFETAVVWDRQ